MTMGTSFVVETPAYCSGPGRRLAGATSGLAACACCPAAARASVHAASASRKRPMRRVYATCGRGSNVGARARVAQPDHDHLGAVGNVPGGAGSRDGRVAAYRDVEVDDPAAAPAREVLVVVGPGIPEDRP